MSTEYFLLLFIVGGVAGVLAGYLGIGGGVLLVPVFNEYLRLRGVGIDQATVIAAATSLAVTFLMAGMVAVERSRKGEMVPRAIPPVLAGALLGSMFGAWVATSLPGRTVRIIFGLFIIATALQLAFNNRPHEKADHELALRPLLLFGLGILTGVFSALLGVGGGVLMVPAFILIFHIQWRKASGTSSAIASLTSLIGVAGYFALAGDRLGSDGPAWGVVEWRAALPVAIAGLLTARIGTWLSRRFSGRVYHYAFALLLIAIAARMLFSVR